MRDGKSYCSLITNVHGLISFYSYSQFLVPRVPDRESYTRAYAIYVGLQDAAYNHTDLLPYPKLVIKRPRILTDVVMRDPVPPPHAGIKGPGLNTVRHRATAGWQHHALWLKEC